MRGKPGRPAFIMFRRRSFLFWQLIQRRPTAFVLLSVIVQRARYITDPNAGVTDLKIGEALLGDHENYGVSTRQYRTDKEYLKEYGLASFRKTNRGTVALLLTTDIFDINAGGERQTKSQSGRSASDKQSDSEATSNKKAKKVKEDKEEGALALEPQRFSSLDDLTEEDFEIVSQKYKVPIPFVRSKFDDLTNYCEAKDKRYKNYFAVLSRWVKDDAIKLRKEAVRDGSKRGIDARGIK